MTPRNDLDDFDDIDDDDDDAEGNPAELPTQEEIDQVVRRGLKAAMKGENATYLLEVMTSLFPKKAREGITKRFSAALAQKRLPQPSNTSDLMPRSKLVPIYRMFTKLLQQQAAARVTALMASKPETAADVKKQGKKLVRKGVKGDKDHLTGSDISDIVPSAATAKPKRDQGKKSDRGK